MGNWKVALAIALVALGLSARVIAEQSPTNHIRRTVDSIAWSANPMLPPGVQVAVLAGDPAKADLYVMRVKIPANIQIKPHSHPDAVRMITVLSGTLYLGFGAVFDADKLVPMAPGTFFTEPSNAAPFRDDERGRRDPRAARGRSIGNAIRRTAAVASSIRR